MNACVSTARIKRLLKPNAIPMKSLEIMYFSYHAEDEKNEDV